MEILTHCLDACALIAYLRNEKGSDVLSRLIEQEETLLAMHIYNLGEVYYDFYRSDGLEAASTAWQSAMKLPLELRRDSDDEFIQRAGIIKVSEVISYADAFALALAERLQVPLVTTDHREFDPVERRGKFKFLWLR
ncbi:MAG: type II toxin-antitoxin system VapC family toxin [bacterium]